MATLAFGCSDSERARAEAGVRPRYDKTTGKLTELTLDCQPQRPCRHVDRHGRRPSAPDLASIANEDGKVDRWEYYDSQAGKLIKVGFSRKDDGKPDAWAFAGPDGRDRAGSRSRRRVTRRRSIAGSITITTGAHPRWKRIPTAMAAADKWETYRAGVLTTASSTRTGDGRPDRRLTYRDGALARS